MLAFLMVIAACGAGSNQSDTSVGVAPTTVPLETAEPTSGRGAAPTTTPTAPTTNDEETEPDVKATVAPRPSGISLEHVDVTTSGVLAHGYTTEPDTGVLARPMIWFSDDYATWVETSVVDLYQDLEPWAVPTVTDVAIFGGQYYAFLMGDDSTDATEPSMLELGNFARPQDLHLPAAQGRQVPQRRTVQRQRGQIFVRTSGGRKKHQQGQTQVCGHGTRGTRSTSTPWLS